MLLAPETLIAVLASALLLPGSSASPIREVEMDKRADSSAEWPRYTTIVREVVESGVHTSFQWGQNGIYTVINGQPQYVRDPSGDRIVTKPWTSTLTKTIVEPIQTASTSPETRETPLAVTEDASPTASGTKTAEPTRGPSLSTVTRDVVETSTYVTWVGYGVGNANPMVPIVKNGVTQFVPAAGQGFHQTKTVTHTKQVVETLTVG